MPHTLNNTMKNTTSNRSKKIAQLRASLKFFRSIHSSENIVAVKARLLNEYGIRA